VEITRLQRENEQLRSRLERAERIIDVQKKVGAPAWDDTRRDPERRDALIAMATDDGSRDSPPFSRRLNPP